MKHLLLIFTLLFVFGCDTGTNNNKLNYNHLVWVVATLDSVKYPLHTSPHYTEWSIGIPDTLINNSFVGNYRQSFLIPQNARLYSYIFYPSDNVTVRIDTIKASTSADTMYWDIK